MIIIKKNKLEIDQYKEIKTIDEIEKYNFFYFDFDFWLTNKNYLKKFKNKFGIEISSDNSLEQIKSHISFFKIIIINFKTFKDGRPFSIARKLRESLKYKSEIRASGHILPDQYIFLLRCGFNSVKIKKEDKDIWLKILKDDLGIYYQPTMSKTHQ